LRVQCIRFLTNSIAQEEPWLRVPKSLEERGYGAVLWVRDNGIASKPLIASLTHELCRPLAPLAFVRPHRHVCSMLRWGMSRNRCLVAWNPSSTRQQLPGQPRVLLLQVHWVSKRALWRFLLGDITESQAISKMASYPYPPLAGADYFPFCDLFELY
jgi:hypothetical protein